VPSVEPRRLALRSLSPAIGYGAAGAGLVGVAALCMRAAVSRPATSLIFRDLLVEDLRAVVPVLIAGAIGLLGAGIAGGRRALAWLADHPLSVALFTFAICALLAVGAYQRRPLSMDEVAPLFQARVFASGRLMAQFAPDQLPWLFSPHRLGVFFFAHPISGQVVSAYWPGMALLFAPLATLDAAYLVNPLLAGATVWLLRHVALEATGGERETTGAAMALLIASPCFLINGASYFAMNAHLAANLGFVALLQTSSTRRLVLAGALGGFAFSLHNPLPHLLFAWPWWWLQLKQPDWRRRLGALGAGYVPTGLLLVVGWHKLADGLREPGGAIVGSSAFRLPDVEALFTRALGLGKLVLWAPLLLCPLAAWGAWQRHGRPFERALGASALSFLLAYLLVKFDQGHGWGYRYFQPAFATLPLLAAGGLVALSAARREVMLRVIAASSVASLLVVLPQRALQVRDRVSAHAQELVRHDDARSCVHFIDPNGYYTADLIVNDPNLEGDLFLTHRGQAQVDELRQRWFPATRFERAWRRDTTYCGNLDAYKRAALASPPARE
jgi:hypothetical protein